MHMKSSAFLKKMLLIVAIGAVACGCGGSKSGPNDEPTPAEPELTAQETTRMMLDALAAGDVDTFLAHVDVRGIYERFPAAMRRVFTYEQFTDALAAAKAKVRVGDAELTELQKMRYEVLGGEERDGLQVVTFRTLTAVGKSWKVWEAYFRDFDGTWKLTGKAVRRIRTEPVAPGDRPATTE
jgi:hypothetical protein